MSASKIALSELAELQVGFAFKSSLYSQGSTGRRLLRGDNIGQGILRWDRGARWEHSSEVRYELREGDVVIAMDRPWIDAGLKYATVTRADLPALLVQRVARLRAKPGNDQRYLHYLIASSEFTEHILSVQTGTAVPHVSGGQILNFRTVRHPLSEQQVIAGVLGAFDDKIAANYRLIAMVDDMLAARFASLLKAGDSTTLSSIARVNVATTRPVPGGSLRYLDISSVRQGTYDYPEESLWDEAPGRARRVVRRFDTVWSTVRPNRRSHALVLDSDLLLVASTGLAVLTPNVGRCAGLYEAAKRPEFESFLLSVAEGSAYPAVRADRFADAPVPNLTDAEWEEFEAVALPARERAHAAAVESRQLAAARNELLPLLLSGKVKVNDVQGSV